MAKRPHQAAQQDEIDPDKLYRVQLTKPVELNGAKLLPRHATFIRGKHLDGLKDSIASIDHG